MSIKIFISHAAADEKLATAHVDCIYSCMVPDDDEVRCTSVPGINYQLAEMPQRYYV